MQITSPTKSKTTLKAKITLVIFGVLFFFILLEIGLRAGGFVLLSIQEYKNRQSMKQKGAYRIMCVGDSTTQGQYPVFLEEILNQRNTGIKFSVIDRGLAGTTNSAILERLNFDLDKYHPDMVVAMMGASDSQGYVSSKAATTSKAFIFLRSFRTYKLVRFLWSHMLEKSKKRWPYNLKEDKYDEPIPNEDSFKKAIELNPQDVEAYIELGRFYQDRGEFSLADDAFRKAIELHPEIDNEYFLSLAENTFRRVIEPKPKNYYVCMESGWFYRDQGKFSQAEDAFKNALKLNSQNDRAYFELGRLYRYQAKFSQAEDAFNKAIELNPQNDRVYLEVVRLYGIQNKLPQAEYMFNRAVELSPGNYHVYTGLGWLYQYQNKFSQAEEAFKRAIELGPQNDHVYFSLGRLYQDQAKFSQAEDAFKKAIVLNPVNYLVYFRLGRLCWDQGKFLQAEEAFKKVVKLNPKNYYAHLELGRFYRDQGKFPEAEDIFKRAIESNPYESNTFYAALSALYEGMGKPELAEEYIKKVHKVRLGLYDPVKSDNYRKFKEILDKRKIRLACVQYAMRSIGPLKKIFQGNEGGIIFVDNEKIFKDSVKKEGNRIYFRDMFAGDFGHCTEKGNRLLAGNIASVILKEVFNK